MADDLSARLRRETIPVLRSRAEVAARNGLVTPVYALDLLTLLDALDAAPPPERVLPAPLTLAEIHEVAAACAAVQPIHNSYVEVQLDLDTWAKFRAALSPDSGADPEPPCPTCGTWAGGACQAKEGQRCGWDDSPRDDSGGPIIEEPQRVIVDFTEVEPQHSPLRTWPTDPEPQP